GNHALATDELRRALLTGERPWYQRWRVWRPAPEFDPVAFRADLERLRRLYRSRGYYQARVAHDLELPAEGDALTAVVYIDEGPPAVCGEVRVAGTRGVDPEAVRRELAFRQGDPFKASLLERTRANLMALRLFRTIRIDEDKSRDPRVAVRIRVIEAPRHEVRFGVGYDTEEQLRGLAGWRDYDFLGGARQLGFTARASFLRRSIAADFLQPHFPGAHQRLRLIASEDQEDEETYTDDRARFTPRLELQPLPALMAYAFYRLEYDSLSGVNRMVARRLPDLAPHSGLLSGVGLGADWNWTDDLLDPTRGWVTSASVEPA